MSEFHDLEEIGEKIVEMADRVKTVHAAIPGAQATWVLEVDDIRFKVVVTVDQPAPPQPRTSTEPSIVADHRLETEGTKDVAGVIGDFESTTDTLSGKNPKADDLPCRKHSFLMCELESGELLAFRVLLQKPLPADVKMKPGHDFFVQLRVANKGIGPSFPAPAPQVGDS